MFASRLGGHGDNGSYIAKQGLGGAPSLQFYAQWQKRDTFRAKTGFHVAKLSAAANRKTLKRARLAFLATQTFLQCSLAFGNLTSA